MVLTYSAHYPTDCFSNFCVLILKHLQKVLKSLNDDLQESLLVWTLGNRAQCHQGSILALPVLLLDVLGNKSHNWLHNMVCEQY